MQHYTTTVSQKGQVVIPKQIRDQIGLKAADVLTVSLKEDEVVFKPAVTTNEAFGLFKTKKPITKPDIKQTVQQKVQQKFAKK